MRVQSKILIGWVAATCFLPSTAASANVAVTDTYEQTAPTSPSEVPLPRRAVVWCVARPHLFAISARVAGLDIGERPQNDKFVPPGTEEPITLEAWAKSDRPREVEDFTKACLPAYEAFSPSAGSSGGGEDWGALIGGGAGGLFAALVGAGAGYSGSLALERRGSRREQAEALRGKGQELRTAVGQYLAAPAAAGQQKATNAASVLLVELESRQDKSPEQAKNAVEALKNLLRDGSRAEPSLNDLSSSTAKDDIVQWSGEASAGAEAIAREVEKAKD